MNGAAVLSLGLPKGHAAAVENGTASSLGDQNNHGCCADGSLESGAGVVCQERALGRCQCLAWAVSLATACLLCGGQVRWVLRWLEEGEGWAVGLSFGLLFCAVSFPCAWGYVALCLAGGYLFGLTRGLLLVVSSAALGLLAAHLLVRHSPCVQAATRFVLSRLLILPPVVSAAAPPPLSSSLLQLLQGPQAFRVVLLARLTPIPFGLQNALFALSHMDTPRYMAATVLGLLPTQLLNVYFGSTFRSMEDVLSDRSTAAMGWAVLAVQICIGMCLMLYVVQKARAELHRSFQMYSRETSSVWRGTADGRLHSVVSVGRSRGSS